MTSVQDERGTVTLLIVGFAVVLLMMAAVVTDASAAYLQRQGLDTLADGAALTAAASEGARYAATLDRDPADGAARTRSQISGVLAGRYATDVTAREVTINGALAVEVTVHVVVPALGIGGPAVSIDVSGHAIEEQP